MTPTNIQNLSLNSSLSSEKRWDTTGLVYKAKPAEVVAYAKSLMQQKNLRLSTKAAYFKPWQGLRLAWIGLTRCCGLQHLYKTS